MDDQWAVSLTKCEDEVDPQNLGRDKQHFLTFQNSPIKKHSSTPNGRIGFFFFLQKAFLHVTGKSADVNNKMNDGCFSLRVLLLCVLTHCHIVVA